MFFFGDYEGFRQLQQSLNFDTIPNLTDRAGVLPGTVVNPVTGSVYPANTPIPLSRHDSVRRQVLNELPAPERLPGASNNYQALLLTRDYATSTTPRSTTRSTTA